VQPATVTEIDPNPNAPVATLRVSEGATAKAPLVHAAIQAEVGDEVQVVWEAGEEWARICLPPAEILPELQAQGLCRDLDITQFEEVCREGLAMDETPAGLDNADILGALCWHYGREDDEQELIAEDALDRAVADRILVFQDSHETPDLVEDAVAALADALLLDVMLIEEADFNDVFEALGEALETRTDFVFLLPMGVNDTAIMVRHELEPSKLTLFTKAEGGPS
jgi:hypothetical protein